MSAREALRTVRCYVAYRRALSAKRGCCGGLCTTSAAARRAAVR